MRPFGSGIPSVAMSKEEERELREQLARLQQEHRDLDAAISALEIAPGSDLLQVATAQEAQALSARSHLPY